ncbi:AIPR family protein [uncultured Methanolobus sp.]|uniref:AIPR family protein n=1 Tax=uncultured Methanolobus sp. TaxID=218300 RepID=UPI002AAAF264|nr:AIPR family protein [uncultured Methanolobus sp.]
MNINASIVDQRVQSIVENYGHLLPEQIARCTDIDSKKSAAFVLLCMSTMLECDFEETASFLTDGGNDKIIDGLHIGEIHDGEFTITLFQGKYKRSLEGNSTFPENEIIKIINIVGSLFDPNKTLDLNINLVSKVEEIRSLVRDGYIPYVRVVLCNNGKKWNDVAQNTIDASDLGDQVEWSHVNHDYIVGILQSKKEIKETVLLTGKAITEDFNYRRVLIGKVPVREIQRIFVRHGDRLLERNIRRYLGLNKNRVNSAIRDTLVNDTKRDDFYFFNNGITMICNKFRYNALQAQNYQVHIEGMQIINGGQTCKTIEKTLSEEDIFDNVDLQNVHVMLRLYELSEDDEFVRDITYATNSQNPVDLKDLRSNDETQTLLEMSLKDLGYTYKRHREEGISGSNVITPGVAASAILAIWREKPHLAKFRTSEHFGKLYDEIFDKNLNSSQLAIAVLILRFVENERKRPTMDNPPNFLPYSSYFIAMLIGKKLLKELEISLDKINHSNFEEIKRKFNEEAMNYYEEALNRTDSALAQLWGDTDISLQRLSATFRRGDLLEYFNT